VACPDSKPAFSKPKAIKVVGRRKKALLLIVILLPLLEVVLKGL
jgi:hypothetical protein